MDALAKPSAVTRCQYCRGRVECVGRDRQRRELWRCTTCGRDGPPPVPTKDTGAASVPVEIAPPIPGARRILWRAKPCSRCGQAFQPTGPNARYCGRCRRG